MSCYCELNKDVTVTVTGLKDTTTKKQTCHANGVCKKENEPLDMIDSACRNSWKEVADLIQFVTYA